MLKVQDWIAEHIESRISRGKQWREDFPEHARLAKGYGMFGFLGMGFAPCPSA